MPMPTGISTVTVTGTYVHPDGTPLRGSVTFTAPALLALSGADTIAAGSATFTLDQYGSFTAVLVATNHPNMQPTGWAYVVKEAFADVAGRIYNLLLPSTAPVVNIADVAPVDPGQLNYVPVAGPAGPPGADGKTILSGHGAPTGTVGTNGDYWLNQDNSSLFGPKVSGTWPAQGIVLGGGGLIQSVNGLQGVVELTAASVGADPAGSAATAQVAAQSYADGQASASLASAAADATGKVTAHIGAADPHGDRAAAAADATGKVAAHTGASDPHGDRAWAAANLLAAAALPSPQAAYSPVRRLPQWRQPAAVLTTMQAGHGFTMDAGGPSGAVATLNDGADCISGTQAAKIVSSGTGATTYLSKTGLPTFDTTGRALRIRFKIDDISTMSAFNIYLGSGGAWANSYKWAVAGVAAGSNFVTGGEWQTLTLNWHDAVTTGAPARNALTDVRFHLIDTGATVPGAKATLHVQSVELIPDGTTTFPNGVVSFAFDDCYVSQFTTAKPALDAAGYPASIYPIADIVGTAGRLTLAQLRLLQDVFGWEIAAHAYRDVDHLASYTGMSAAALDDDLRRMKAWVSSNGFRGADGTAYPLGQYGKTTDGQSTTDIVRQYFAYARTTHSKTKETFPPADPYRLRSISSISTFAGGYAPSALTTATTGDIARAKANGTWLILTFHDIVPDATTLTGPGQCKVSDFLAIVAAIVAAGIPVLPVGDVLRYNL